MSCINDYRLKSLTAHFSGEKYFIEISMEHKTSTTCENSVAGRFKEMNVSFEKESRGLVKAWLSEHSSHFLGFADGYWISEEWLSENFSEDFKPEFTLHKIKDYMTEEHVYDVSVCNNSEFFEHLYNLHISNIKEWTSNTSTRSKTLYKVAKTIEKHQQLFAIVESLSSGKSLARVKSKDIPSLINSFYYYAGCAWQLELENRRTKAEDTDCFPIPHTLFLIDKYSLPLLSLSLRVSSALAAGTSVLVCAHVQNCLSACLLAELCIEAGMPKNILNVIPFEETPVLSKSYQTSLKKQITGQIENSTMPWTVKEKEFLILRRPVVIIYENADLPAAAEGVLESFCYNNIQSNAGGCKVIVQQSVLNQFVKILEEKFSKTPLETVLSKNDMCISPNNKNELSMYVEEAAKHAKVFKFPCPYCHDCELNLRPTIMSNVGTGCRLAREELGGAFIVVVAARTVKESISLFNSDNKGCPVSIWTEKISIALEVAEKLISGTIWVNSQNVFDASVPFTGVHLSGNTVEGGKEAFFKHLYTTLADSDISDYNDMQFDQSTFPENIIFSSASVDQSKKEYKLHINGEQKKSGDSTVYITERSLIHKASKTDIELAISSARASQSNWQNVSRHKKREILLSIAKVIEARQEEFVSELFTLAHFSKKHSEEEVSKAVDLLYYWAFNADKYGGEVKNISENNKVLQERCPLGVVLIKVSSANPMVSFISILAPALLFGNSVVTLANYDSPEVVLKMFEIFSSCGVPKGVTNVVTGKYTELLQFLEGFPELRHLCFELPAKDILSDIFSLKCLMQVTFSKSIFLPFGEIFAN